MPYIQPELRTHIDRRVDHVADLLKTMGVASTPGLLTYAITRLLFKGLPTGSYAEMQNVVGILECTKLEFARSVMGPYEEKKMQENGGVR